MANLRTNNLSGEQGRNAYRGSVFFDGEEGSYLNLASGALISGTGFGTNDFTVEFWINQGVNASNYTNIISLMHLLLQIDFKLYSIVQQFKFIPILVLGQILDMHQYQVCMNTLHL